MLHVPKLIAAATVALVAGFSAPAVQAETPPDTLLQAWSIDDVISLDPAEVFEFTASEILGNCYQGRIGYDVNDVSNIFGATSQLSAITPKMFETSLTS